MHFGHLMSVNACVRLEDNSTGYLFKCNIYAVQNEEKMSDKVRYVLHDSAHSHFPVDFSHDIIQRVQTVVSVILLRVWRYFHFRFPMSAIACLTLTTSQIPANVRSKMQQTRTHTEGAAVLTADH